MSSALLHENNSTSNSSVVEIQPRGTKPPLYFVHGVGGGMFWGYTNLSRYLGPDQPVYAFNSRGMSGKKEWPTIREMAAQYVADLRAFQPKGPYYIGGYCFGGNVVFEMARQLEAQGEKIAMLSLINCAPPNSNYTRFRINPFSILRFLKNLACCLGYVARMSTAQRRGLLHWKVRAFKKRCLRLLRRPQMAVASVDVDEIVDLSGQPEDRRELWAAHVRILMAHHTKPYAGHVALFRTRTHPLFCSYDEAFGWGDYAAAITVQIVPGAHESVLDEPHVQKLAELLRHRLHEIQTNQSGGNLK